MPLISIIIPVYKIQESYLRECIESAMNQTLTDIEIILVDDGSPDNCGAICDEYAQKDSRIKVIHHQQNRWLSAARNSGIRAASGKYITLVDGDDWIEPNLCETAYSAIQEQNVDLVVWAFFQDYGENKKITMRFLENDTLIADSHYLRSCGIYRMDRKRANPATNAICGSWSKLYARKAIIDNDIFFNESIRFGEDWEHTLRHFAHIKSAYYISTPLHHYRINNQSATKKYIPTYLDASIKALTIMRDYIYNEKDPDYLIKPFWLAVCIALVTCGVYNTFHPDNPKGFAEQYNDFKKLVNTQPFKDAIRYANLSVFPLSHSISMLLIRYKLYFGFYLVCKFRSFQVMHWLKK